MGVCGCKKENWNLDLVTSMHAVEDVVSGKHVC